jgi:CDGSH-type Zn-finger protein
MTQPFCDGSHEGTDMEPMSIVIEEKTTVWLCRWLSAESPQKNRTSIGSELSEKQGRFRKGLFVTRKK